MIRRLVAARRQLLAGLAVALLLAAGVFSFFSRWTAAEIAEARQFQAAIYDVEAANGLIRRHGGALEPEPARQVLALYERAAAAAQAVSVPVLAKIHDDLPEQWRDRFQKSVTMYIGALKAEDRDGARQAALLQDEWHRWYGSHRDALDLPETTPR
jgi:hypothetical protein